MARRNQVQFTGYTDDELGQQVEQAIDEHGYRSESAFVVEALRNQVQALEGEHTEEDD